MKIYFDVIFNIKIFEKKFLLNEIVKDRDYSKLTGDLTNIKYGANY